MGVAGRPAGSTRLLAKERENTPTGKLLQEVGGVGYRTLQGPRCRLWPTVSQRGQRIWHCESLTVPLWLAGGAALDSEEKHLKHQWVGAAST